MSNPTKEMREGVLKGKSEREQLEMKAHWALSDLSDYFDKKRSPLYCQVNELIHNLSAIREEGGLR